jgi:hypothetical protein
MIQLRLVSFRRFIVVLYELGFFLVSLFSRCLNLLILGGSIHQTTSARVETEVRSGNIEWYSLKLTINRIFFLQEDHCAGARDEELRRARETLRLNKE